MKPLSTQIGFFEKYIELEALLSVISVCSVVEKRESANVHMLVT